MEFEIVCFCRHGNRYILRVKTDNEDSFISYMTQIGVFLNKDLWKFVPVEDSRRGGEGK